MAFRFVRPVFGATRVQRDVADRLGGDDVEEPGGEVTRDPVAHQPAVAVGGDHAVPPEQPQGVRDRAVGHPDGKGEIGHAEVACVVQGEQDREPVGIAQRVEQPSRPLNGGPVGEHGDRVAHLVRVDDPLALPGRVDLVH